MGDWKVVLNRVASLVALVAAHLWFRSATVRIPANPPPRDEKGMFAAQITVNDADFIATAVHQTRWNKWAAVAAGINKAPDALVTGSGRQISGIRCSDDALQYAFYDWTIGPAKCPAPNA